MAFKVGDKIQYKDDPETKGEVLEVRDDNVSTGPKYLIKIPNTRWTPDWMHEDQLEVWDSTADTKRAGEIQALIDEGTEALEKAWEAFSNAKEMAYKHSSMASLARQGLVDLGKFESVAENFGWSSSSLHC